MSVQRAHQFLAFVDTYAPVQRVLNSVDWNPMSTTKVAAEHGYDFTPQELEQATVSAWGTLSEDDLRNIAGGGGHGNGNGHGGHGRDDDDDDHGGHWSPPPGDVSGNSCFFGRKG